MGSECDARVASASVAPEHPTRFRAATRQPHSPRDDAHDRKGPRSIDRAPRARAKLEVGTMIRVTVWGENVHEKKSEVVAKIYPRGMHECIAEGLRRDADLEVRTATLDMQEHGLTKEVLETTDVLT